MNFRRKLLLIMKSTAVILLAACLSVSAKGLAQRVSFSMNHVSLNTVLNEISRQTGLSVFCDESLLKQSKPVSIHAKQKSIQDVLKECLASQGLRYTIEDNTIYVERNATQTNSDKLSSSVIQSVVVPVKTIYGQVTDSVGNPIANASILVVGTKRGVMSDANGKFSISARSGDVLEISYIGYTSQKITVGDNNEINIQLRANVSSLNDFVVTALGIKRTARSTSYNVQTLQGSDVTGQNDVNLASALVGKVAGATVNASASGVGGSVRLVLRGTKSITGNNNALYVIDGIPMPNLFTGQPGGVFGGSDGGEGIANFNPDDIESISVLSGASAAALYGYEAANGVILITTKKGIANRTRVNFSSGVTFAKPFVLPELQDTYAASASSNGVPNMASWGAKLSSPSNYSAKDFFQTGTNYTNSVSVATGTDRSQTYFSAAAVNSDGIIHNNNYSRYNFSIRNTSVLIPNKLDLDVSAMYVKENRQNTPPQGQYNNPLVGAYLFPAGDIDSSNYVLNNYQQFNPTRNFYTQNWAFGDLGLEAQNPNWITNKEFFNTNRSRFLGSVALKYTVNDNLFLTGRVKYDEANDVNETRMYASTINFLAGGDNGFFGYGTGKNQQTYADLMLNYAKKLTNFDFKFILGSSIQDNRNSGVSAGGTLNSIPNFFSFSNISNQGKLGASSTLPQIQQNQAVFGTADLAFKNRLFLTITGRNDWNSALAYTTASSIFYPSIGMSAILSDMMKLPQVISYAKLRASYAEVGNPPSIYLSYPESSFDNNGALTLATAAPFTTLKPERTKSREAGIDLRFFHDKLNASFTYYNTNTYNQLFNAAVNSGAGQNNQLYSTYYINAGNINNKGIEASLGATANLGSVVWTPSITFSLNRNKIIQLLPGHDTTMPAGGGTYAQWLTVGGSAGDIYTTGLKTNSDGSLVTTTSATFPNATVPVTSDSMRKVGNSNPRYNIGFSNGFSYKGFNLRFTIAARIGGQVVSGTQAMLDYYGASKTSADARNKGSITVDGTTFNDVPAYYQTIAQPSGGGLNNVALSQYVYSATNVRLSELSVGYTFQHALCNNVIKSLGLNVFARNLWMIYNKAPFDPESAASTGTFYQGYDLFNQPSQRFIGVKLNVAF